jgi:DNA repair protein RadC
MHHTVQDPVCSFGTAGEPSDLQLLLQLIGTSRHGSSLVSAQRLLEFAGSIEGLARLAPAVIAEQAGIGRAQARRLHAAFELGRRQWTNPARRSRIDSVQDVVAWARPRLVPLDHEEVWLLCLDGRNSMRSSRRVAQGGLHSCALTAKDILRPALRDGASGIVLVHNHPSGDPTPSDADISMTSEVDIACAAIGLPLLDHVVIGSEGATSLLELGVVRAG